MHTKKTNNTNKLMQISYHYALKKIQKLQNYKKKKKKNFFLYRLVCLVPAGIVWNWPVFKSEQNVNVSISVFIPVWYIPTDMVLTTLIISLFVFFCWTYSIGHFFFLGAYLLSFSFFLFLLVTFILPFSSFPSILDPFGLFF